MYCTDDASVSTLGDGTKEEGEMSPKNLLTTTITDELRMGTNFKGKYWYEFKRSWCHFTSRSFCKLGILQAKPGHSFLVLYGKQLPDWVRKFNDEKHYMPYINNGWDLYRPKAI
jgi:hypothetical protein